MQLEKFLRHAVIGGIFAVPLLVPFVVADSMFFPYITGKNFTFRILVEFLFAAWVVLALLNSEYRPRRSWIMGIFAAFVATAGLADLLGVDPLRSVWSNFERMEGYLTLLHVFAYFVVASAVITTEKLWWRLLNASLGASVLISLIGFGNLYTFFTGGGGAARIYATLGNPIYLAIYAVFHIFIAALLCTKVSGSRWLQVYYGAAIAMLLVVLYFTATRGAILGLIGGALLSALALAVFDKRKLPRIIGLSVLGAILLSVGAFIAVKDTQFIQESPVLGRFATISLERGTSAARLIMWGIAWEGIKERPVLGWGQENFGYVFDTHYDPQMFGQEPWFDHVHNSILDWFIAGGAVGLALYLALPLAVLYYLWIYRREDSPFSVVERSLITGLLAAYFFHNLFVFDSITSYIMYMLLLAYVHTRATEWAPRPLFAGRSIPAATVSTVALPVMLIVALGTAYAVNAGGINTAQTIITAITNASANPQASLHAFRDLLDDGPLGAQEVREQLLQSATGALRNPQIPNEARQEFVALAQSGAESMLAQNPNITRLRLFYGSMLADAGAYAQAIEQLEAAHELSPRKQQVLFHLGEVYLRQGQFEKAVEYFRQAYELAPEFNEPAMLYAIGLLYAGEQARAEELLTQHYGTAAVNDQRLVQTYSQLKLYEPLIAILTTQVAASPDNPQLRTSLAAALYESGNATQAIAELEEVARRVPQTKPQIDGFIEAIRDGRPLTSTE